jgi:hypothetical protein
MPFTCRSRCATSKRGVKRAVCCVLSACVYVVARIRVLPEEPFLQQVPNLPCRLLYSQGQANRRTAGPSGQDLEVALQLPLCLVPSAGIFSWYIPDVLSSTRAGISVLAGREVGLCLAWFWEHKLQEETSLLIAVPRVSDQHQPGLFKGKRSYLRR